MCDQSMPMGAEVDEPYHGSFEFGRANLTARRPTHPGCELRASKMYMYCDCNRRNGLQDNCPRTVCHDGNSNQMQGTFSQNDGFATPTNGLYSKNGAAMPFGSQLNGYQEYFGDGIPAGLAIHPYPSEQQSGMRDASYWGGSQQGNQACELRSEGRHMGHMGYGDVGLQRW